MVVGGVVVGVGFGGVGCGGVMGCAICMTGYSNMCDTFDRASLLLLIRLGPFCYTLLKHYLTPRNSRPTLYNFSLFIAFKCKIEAIFDLKTPQKH